MVQSPEQPYGDPQGTDVRLDQALTFQVDLASRGLDCSLERVLEQFPDLDKDAESVLAILYNSYRLTPCEQRAERQRELCDRFPQHAAALDRQIHFGEIVDSCLGVDELSDSWSGDDTVVEFDEQGKEVRDRTNPLASISSIGRFQIERLIGHGGMSSVYLAVDTVIGRQVAIKVPRIRKNSAGAFDERCFEEARIAAKCDHPGLIDILEVGRWRDCFYLVTRYADRGDLATWMENNPGPQPVDQVTDLIRKVAEAVAHCHSQKVLHLDLKPANLLFTSDPERPDDESIFPGKVLVADFGLSRAVELDASDASTTKQFGTLLYMSPEQLDADPDRLKPTIDVFALGVVLYQLLTGHHPFAAATPFGLMQRIYQGDFIGFKHQSHVPGDLQKICLTCLATEPSNRYQTAGELAADLNRFRKGEAVAGLPESSLHRFVRWCRQPKRIEQAAIVSAVGHGAILIGFIAAWTLFCFVDFEFPISTTEISIDIAKLCVFPHLPAVLLSLAVLRGHHSLQWGNVMLGASTVVLVAVTFITGESPIRRYAGEPFAFVVSHVLVFGMAIATFIPQVFSIPALAAIKSRRSKHAIG